MKKIILLILGVFLMVGCSNNETTNSNENLDMKKIESNLQSLSIEDAKPYSDKDSVNDLDLIEGYGIDINLLEEYTIYISSKVEDPSMYMVIKPIEGKESVVKYQVDDMFDKYLSAYKGYYHEIASMIEEKMEKEYGNYLIYIVSDDNKTVYNKIIECKE